MDTFINSYSSLMMSRGDAPYSQIASVHPPGVLFSMAAMWKLGFGLVPQSYVFVFLGVLLSLMTSLFPRLLGVRNGTALAVGFLAMVSSELLFRIEPRVVSHLPATLLALGGVAMLLQDRWGNVVASAVLFVVAAMFRLQALALIPGVVLFNWIVFGWRKGTIRNVVLVGLIVVLQSLVTVGFESRFPGYRHAVYEIQLTRQLDPWLNRIWTLQDLFNKPGWLLGLLAVFLSMGSSDRRLRGLASLTLVTSGVTAFAARSFFDHYFVLVLPYFVICLVVVVARLLDENRVAWPTLTCAIVAAGLQFYNTAEEVNARRKGRAETLRQLAAIENAPESIVLATDPRYVMLCHKKLPDDYYAVDAYLPYVLGWFDEWVERVYPKVDAVIVDEEMRTYLGDRGYEFLNRGKKPIYFFTPKDEEAWKERGRKGPSRSDSGQPEQRAAMKAIESQPRF